MSIVALLGAQALELLKLVLGLIVRQVGDQLDRGDDELPVLYFLERLAREAQVSTVVTKVAGKPIRARQPHQPDGVVPDRNHLLQKLDNPTLCRGRMPMDAGGGRRAACAQRQPRDDERGRSVYVRHRRSSAGLRALAAHPANWREAQSESRAGDNKPLCGMLILHAQGSPGIVASGKLHLLCWMLVALMLS